jgi:hypothetical protein
MLGKLFLAPEYALGQRLPHLSVVIYTHLHADMLVAQNLPCPASPCGREQTAWSQFWYVNFRAGSFSGLKSLRLPNLSSPSTYHVHFFEKLQQITVHSVG